jgi:hypothetical protein
MRGMVIELLAGVPAGDYVRALAWYERLLGRAPDSRSEKGEALWTLAEGGRIAITRDPARAGSAVVDPDGNQLTFAESVS